MSEMSERTSPFVPNAKDHLVAIDRLVGEEVRRMLRFGAGPPAERARVAVAIIRAHINRTSAIATAAQQDKGQRCQP